MRAPHDPPAGPQSRGMSLVEVMIALLVLSLGILAIAQMFPAGTRSSIQSKLRSGANYYSQQKLEELRVLDWNDALLSIGRHPNATDFDTLGASKAWRRAYNVDVLAAPLDNLKRVVVTVNWTYQGARTLTDTLYLRK
jgi:type IV pilus modification protein PilV